MSPDCRYQDAMTSDQTLRKYSSNDVDNTIAANDFFDEKGREAVEDPSTTSWDHTRPQDDYIAPQERENLRELARQMSRTQSQ